MDPYTQLEERFAEIHKLEAIGTLLFWDSKVMMPAQGAASRGEQLATLTGIIQGLRRDPAVPELLEQAEEKLEDLDTWQRANLREMKRTSAHARAVDSDLSVAFSKACMGAGVRWLSSKAQNDFRSFAPHLETVFRLQIQIAQAEAEALGLSVYDALLARHDPGTTTETIDRLFGEVEARLPELVTEVRQAQQGMDRIALPEVPQEKVAKLLERILPQIGWPREGRLDHTEHPFALAGVPGDPRITTHYASDKVLFALLGAFHECGHGLYELNLPKNTYAYQPVGVARGGSTHESQSLGLEMMACRSAPFLHWMFPQLRDVFGVSGPAWSDANLLAHYRNVEPSLIRVNADELTYPLHIVLRYGLEQRILAGELAVRDIPEAWDAEMERLLGIRPSRLADGCLQDIHWSMGLIGYFPTYLLGALKAAQFFATARDSVPGLLDEIGRGEFAAWLDWARQNVHRHASLFTSDELMERATGRPVEITPLMSHFRERYLST